jgi:hypothetical protein
MKSHEFASLLCSRLCHDLLSPVGALNNGIELLADEHDPEMRARCLDSSGSPSVPPVASPTSSTRARPGSRSKACSARTAASSSAGWSTSQ